MEDIYKHIIESFGALWHCVFRGNTIEVVTPYATVNDKFISVFITRQKAQYIVTDGGWYSANEYEFDDNDTFAYNQLFQFYLHQYEIKKLSAPNGLTYFYKTTEQSSLIPNLVFDLCNFISSVVSATFVNFEIIKEHKEQAQFKANVTNYILNFLQREDCRFGRSVDDKFDDVKFNVIINKPNAQLSLISYVTGSTNTYFASSLAKANANIRIIQKSSLIASHINGYYAVINNQAYGYKEGSYLSELQENTNGGIVNWTEREKLSQLIG